MIPWGGGRQRGAREDGQQGSQEQSQMFKTSIKLLTLLMCPSKVQQQR